MSLWERPRGPGNGQAGSGASAIGEPREGEPREGGKVCGGRAAPPLRPPRRGAAPLGGRWGLGHPGNPAPHPSFPPHPPRAANPNSVVSFCFAGRLQTLLQGQVCPTSHRHYVPLIRKFSTKSQELVLSFSPNPIECVSLQLNFTAHRCAEGRFSHWRWQQLCMSRPAGGSF